MTAPASPDLVAAARRARRARATIARGDINEFIHFVMRDQQTGAPLLQQPMHEEWHALADEHQRLVVWGHAESGKSQQMAIGRILFALGQHPRLRCAIISNTSGPKGQATKLLRSVAQYIESSSELHEVFPELRPSPRKSDPWTTEAITVERPPGINDPSVQQCGAFGSILGSRIDFLVVDDLLDWTNTLTEHRRKAVIGWFQASVLSRMTTRSRAIVIGNAWHPDDLMHVLERRGWTALRYPVLDPSGASKWPEQWPEERIEAKRVELGPLEFARQMMCLPRSDEDARFRREWIDQCLERGEGLDLVGSDAEARLPDGAEIWTGVDLAVGRDKSKKHAKSVVFTIAILPDKLQSRRVLAIEAGRWTGPEIVARIQAAHEAFGSIVQVESNAAQQYIVDFTKAEARIPVRSFHTGRNKHDPTYGVESIAVEMSRGQWIIPNRAGQCHPDVQAWIADMLYYHPESHTGDYLMACWIAREGADKGKRAFAYRVGMVDGGPEGLWDVDGGGEGADRSWRGRSQEDVQGQELWGGFDFDEHDDFGG